MAEVIKVWQDYLTGPLDSSSVSSDCDEFLSSAVDNLIKTLGSFGYDDILRTQVIRFILSMLCT